MNKSVISVFTSDKFLFQKIKLSAPQDSEVLLGEDGREPTLRLVDIDTSAVPDGDSVTMSRIEGRADISIPFSLDTVSNLLKKGQDGLPLLRFFDSERCVYLRERKIKLTEVEYSLLSVLSERCGEFAAREEILERVWGGDADSGVINVYIHYLREKLEADGEKIIISSRKCGYKIDVKYLRGGS